MTPVADLYIELLKGSLSGSIHGDAEVLMPVDTSSSNGSGGLNPRSRIRRLLQAIVARQGYTLARAETIPLSFFTEGRYYPSVPFHGETMVGLKRLENVQRCIESVLADGVPGDLIETGVWRGGCAIFMRGVLAAHHVEDRTVWLADSFAGVPPPNVDEYPLDAFSDLHVQPGLAVNQAQVEANFRRYGLLDDQVRFVPGWFDQTLPTLSKESWAVLRLDGDLYQSTMDALTNLYPGLSPGGYCIVDDYGAYEACRAAVHEYRDAHGIEDEIVDIDGWGAYWRRSA